METIESDFSYLINNDLYVFGGNTNDETKIQCGKQLGNIIWKLHLPTMKWSCSEKLNVDSDLFNLGYRKFLNNQDKIYYITDVFYEIDTKKNTIKKMN